MIRRPNARNIAATLASVVIGFSLALASPGRAAAIPPTPQEADSDQAQAYAIVDSYWRRHWSEFFNGTYSSPRVVGLYDSRQTPMPCNRSLWTSNNAWYCDATDSIGFDLAFMERVFKLGDSFIYLVVAHEWGHAIQARLSPELRSARDELQADCLAGAALYGARADGTLRWEAGDVQELTSSLTSVADQFPWTRTGDHGSAAQRIANFNVGAGGPLACLPALPPHLQAQRPDPGVPPAPRPGLFVP